MEEIKVDEKKELIDLLAQILSYFQIPSLYGGIEKDIFNHYKIVRSRCDKFDFKGITIGNWSRVYLEANSDWYNPILETMNRADKLIEYFQQMVM